MGENKHIKELDDFSKKYIKDIDTEKLSPEFTSELMKKIQVLNVYKVQPFTPLISKKVWFLIGLLLVAILSIPLLKCITMCITDLSSAYNWLISCNFFE